MTMSPDKKSSKESPGEKKRSSSPKSRGSGGAGSSGRVEKTHATKSAPDRKQETLKSKLAAKGIKYDSNHKSTSKEQKQSLKTEDSEAAAEANKTEDVYKQKMTVTPDPERRCLLIEVEQIKEAIVDALERLEDGCYPQFYNSHNTKVGLILTCANEQTKQWLEKIVPQLKPWEGAKLCVKPKGLLALGPKVQLTTPKLFAKTEPKKILQMLGTQNKTLETHSWKNVSVKSEASGQTLVYAIDDKSVKAIRALGNKAYLGLGNVELVILNSEEDKKETSADKETKNDESGDKRASVDTDTKNEKKDEKTS